MESVLVAIIINKFFNSFSFHEKQRGRLTESPGSLDCLGFGVGTIEVQAPLALAHGGREGPESQGTEPILGVGPRLVHGQGFTALDPNEVHAKVLLAPGDLVLNE